jgi:NitT/TauT family transport system permease protein
MARSPEIGMGRIWAKQAGYPMVSIFLLLVLWEAWVWMFKVPNYLVPAPIEIFRALWENAALLLANARPSLFEAGVGFLLSIALGVPLAILAVAFDWFGRTVTPFLVFSQVVPKVALAPLLLIWFGFGMTSKVLIVFMMAFFPIFISMTSGLRSVESDMLNMMNSMRPTKYQVFAKVRVPHSLPYLIDGLKLAVTRSVIAAIVAEWISSDKGLGYLILYADAASKTPLLFSIIGVLAVIGLAFFMIVSYLGRLMVPWYFAMRKTEIAGKQK